MNPLAKRTSEKQVFRMFFFQNNVNKDAGPEVKNAQLQRLCRGE
jgi:hypothetical protein